MTTRAVVRRNVVLAHKNGSCSIRQQPEPVTLRRLHGDVVQWQITNPSIGSGPCDRQVRVCIGNFRPLDVKGAPDPVVDDVHRFCREVSPGGPSKRITAHINPDAPGGWYEYDVLVEQPDGTMDVAVDPMIRIVV